MAVNKVEYGDTVLMDLTGDTVSSDTLLKGATAHNASGEPIEGAVDLDNYYTKDEVDEKIPDTAGLATEQFVIQQVSGIDLSPYALKQDIPSTDGFATETYVTESIKANKPDLAPYALKEDIPSTSGLASEKYVDDAIDDIDFTPYALKEDIPSTSGLTTKEYVDGEIADVVAVATGKTASYVFNTVAELDSWLSVSANKAKLNKGDVFLITALNVPDYWWDGSAKAILETTKVDLSGYAKTADVPTIKVNSATNADNALTVGGYTIVISSTKPTNANSKTITFVI